MTKSLPAAGRQMSNECQNPWVDGLTMETFQQVNNVVILSLSKDGLWHLTLEK
jgi:hypothetical protein